ncbi:uncharacterized protein LOC120331975 [Styela clava]
MATKGSPGSYKRYNGFPKSTYTDRTRSMLTSTGPKSNSAMSTRTYSRIKNNYPRRSNSGNQELRKSLTFEDERSPQAQVDNSVSDLQELENEQELLKRMIDQQKQLQELRERQKRVLVLQQQLASMEMNAETSMEEKLSKLKTAKTRLDELQKLVGTIKSAESVNGGGDSPSKDIPDKNQQVKMALGELNELKTLINMMSSEPGKFNRPPVVTLEPVFPNSIGAEDEIEQQKNENYQPVLPEVSVIQYADEQEESPAKGCSKRRSSNRKKTANASPNPAQYPSPYQSQMESARKSPYRIQNSGARKKMKSVQAKSPQKDEGQESSERLWGEMRRHQLLLEELRERRRELEELMNMTNEMKEDDDDEEEEENGEEYNDTNASIRSNLGSPDESRGVSDSEPNNLETSQSDRLFGLSEPDTRRLIDLIRNQKSLGATTEKTTATWGSSSSGSSNESSDDENVDDSRLAENNNTQFRNAFELRQRGNALSKPTNQNQNNSMVPATFRDAFTQLDYKKEHEIDFRPPTRRRRNITQQPITPAMDSTSLKGDIGKLQEDLLSSNATMHLLLEDQKSLSQLLLNTLNLQQTSVSGNLCYGISPDFLIYQLDNCSAQFASILKETKELYWQMYGLTKNPESSGKPTAAQATRTPLATLDYVSEPLTSLYQNQQDSFALKPTQAEVPSKETMLANAPFMGDGGGFQFSETQMYASVQQEQSEASVDADNDLFEALRDSIYSEAAILISQNEARPHFLIELFHSLQQLDTDYLRQHALYVLQDVMKGYIPSSPRKNDKAKQSPTSFKSKKRNPKKGSFSENTPSESAATSEDELYAKLKARASADTGYDLSLKVSSASELSTPSGEGNETNPFAADDLGSTVIHLDAALRHMREMERMKQEILSSANIGKRVLAEQGPIGAIKKPDKNEVPHLNTKLLRARIKHIVSEVIPLLKANHDKTLDKKLVNVLQSKIVQCVGKGMDENRGLANGFPENGEGDDVDKVSMESFFSGQLNSILDDSFKKFLGQRIGSCGEDLVVGLSEVLFNELAFFYMMQDLDKSKQDAAKLSGVPTIKIDQDGDGQVEDEEEESNSQEEAVNDDEDQNGEDSEVSNGVDVPDSELQDKSNMKDSSTKNPVTVDLSVSETKPLTSYGSGEDEEEEGSGEEYEYQEQDVPTSMQHDADDVAPKNDGGISVENIQEEQNIENDNKENQPDSDESDNKTE